MGPTSQVSTQYVQETRRTDDCIAVRYEDLNGRPSKEAYYFKNGDPRIDELVEQLENENFIIL